MTAAAEPQIATIADVLPAALTAVGVPGWGYEGALPVARRAVVLLVDGLGARLLAESARRAPFLASCDRGTATAPFPSSTATSLTSLGTALPPARHGVVGFRTLVPGTGRTLNALRWSPDLVDPLVWQPCPTVYERAAVPTAIVTPPAFAGTGLTLACARGATHLGAATVGQRLAATAEWVAGQRAPALAYCYLGDLDATGHLRGWRSEAWRAELGQVDSAARTLAGLLPARTLLVVTADHGMVDVPLAGRIDVDTERGLLEGVAVLAGEPRARYLHVASGRRDDVLARWRERVGERGEVVTREQAEQAGWFGGRLADAVRGRVGDVIVAAGPDLAVVATQREPFDSALIGLHGARTPDEVDVPLLVVTS